MFRLTIQNTWAHKRRLLGTFLAVLIGVSFLAGTLVLSDTLRGNFDDLFNKALGHTDVVVQPTTPKGGQGSDDGYTARTLDASLADRIGAVPGVAAAEPKVEGFGQLVGSDGQRVGGEGPPTLVGNWLTEGQLNPYHLSAGRAPVGPEEVVVDQGAMTKAGFAVGDTATLLLPQPLKVHIVGIARFGDAESLGGATFTGFSDAGAAAHIVREPGQASQIVVQAESGVSQAELASRIEPLVGHGNEVLTGHEAVQRSLDDLSKEFLDFLTTFLVMFAAIALLVATFSIYNTFSILVAQRTRESALLRTIGASKRQVMSSTLIEAFVIGVLASAAGLGVGIAVAGGLKGVFDAFGFNLPTGGITFSASTAIVAMVVGVVVTMVAALGPARRASRVAPIEALRSSEVESVVAGRRRIVIGSILGVGGVALLVFAVTAKPSAQLTWAGISAVAILAAMVALGPVAARPAARLLGAGFARRGVPGELARDNAARNPRRTSSTASALMVGVAVVVLFSVMISSAAAYVSRTVDQRFAGDLVVSSGGFGSGTLPTTLTAQVRDLPGVTHAAGLGHGTVTVGGQSQDVSVTEPRELAHLIDITTTSGSIAAIGDGDIGVSTDEAKRLRVHEGDQVTITLPDGTTARPRVAAIFDGSGILDGQYVLPHAAWQGHTVLDAYTGVFVKLAPGASIASTKAELKQMTRSMGRPDVQDRAEYTDSIAGQLNQLLGLITVMLALAILIAVMGITNTLALSVYERSREIGLLRAVGTTRRQVRRLVRWESVIISCFGTAGGIGLGIVLGWALVGVAFTGSDTAAFSIPVTQLVVTALIGAAVGVLAAIRPARRAAKRDVLEALALA